MLDLSVAGPMVTLLAGGDALLHVYLDVRKVMRNRDVLSDEGGFPDSGAFLVLSAIATLCSFWMVGMIVFSWVAGAAMEGLPLLSVLWAAPELQWGLGLGILAAGIIFHGWSRAVRRDMASSWEMDSEHVLVTRGPYKWIRHPSYAAYMLSFVGLFLMWPSILGLVLLMGIPGYYYLSKSEEQHLIDHFGDDYINYMSRTGAFFPRFRQKAKSNSAPKP
ncbi:isoprenylcysteine carboxylmethyltransferase family protein [Candidatus Thorarchaeota archaeon]|nr:MAG: isoprenylcysteine carboxylmethyltransferase family protein [Candidatus Thorarchaeota archaeon]